MTELEKTHSETGGEFCRIDVAIDYKVVGRLDNALNEIAVGRRQLPLAEGAHTGNRLIVLVVELAVLVAQLLDISGKLLIDCHLTAVAAIHQEPHNGGYHSDGNRDNDSPDFGAVLLVIFELEPIVAKLGIVAGEILG